MFLLVDINSYFATLLQQENPALRGKPVVILKDLGRSCVIAASKEAKKLGVKTGTSLTRAKQLAPDLIERKAEFELYFSATCKLKELFFTLAPQVDIYSLDEAFINISDCRKNLYSDVHQLGSDIQVLIKQELGEWVTANVGISHNRFLAKLAAEVSPKGSVFEINQENLDSVLAKVPCDELCGIGSRLSKKLARVGVFYPYQLRFYTTEDLEPLFGPFWSRELLKMAYGQEPHHLQLLDVPSYAKQAMRSASRSITMWDQVKDQAEIKRILYNLTREVIYKIRRMGKSARRVEVCLIGSNHLLWRQGQTYQSFFSHTQEVFGVIKSWLQRFWQQQFHPIKFVVVLSLLESNQVVPEPLLPDWQQQEAVESAIDELDSRYGLYTVRSGLLVEKKQIVQSEVTGFLGDKEYQFNYR